MTQEVDAVDPVERSGRPPAYPPTRRGARTGAMLVYAAVLGTWCALAGVPDDFVQVFLWLWLATIAWNVEARPSYHLRFLRDWWLPVLGLVVYFLSRGFTDDLGLPVHVTMPIRFDEWLGQGRTPTERLQEAWCGEPCHRWSDPHWYDLVLTTVYASHFVTGLTIAAVLWLRDRTAWVRWMRRYLTINFAGLAIYILYPMAPPWLASREGHLGHVLRLTSRGWREIGLDRIHLILQGVGNPVAAMPSLHAGIAFLVAGWGVQRLRSRWRWLLLAYPLTMCTALLYFGEHYVIDELAGALLAVVVLAGCQLWETTRGDPAGPGPHQAVSPRSASPTG